MTAKEAFRQLRAGSPMPTAGLGALADQLRAAAEEDERVRPVAHLAEAMFRARRAIEEGNLAVARIWVDGARDLADHLYIP